MNYRPVPYSRVIDLFQPHESPAPLRHALARELKRLAPGTLRIHAVPGDHYSFLRGPLVDATAKAVDAALEAATVAAA